MNEAKQSRHVSPAVGEMLLAENVRLKAALQYIARGYSGDVGNCEGHSGTHCAEVARAALAKAKP